MDNNATEGTKHDSGKPRMDLVYPEAKLALAHVFTHGLKAHDERNCEKGFAYGRISGALERHLTAWQAGQDVDPDSGLPHLWHVLWNSATLVMMTERGIGTDDRAKGAAMHMWGEHKVGAE